MDPFNAPSFDAPVNYGSELKTAVANTAPLANTWHGAQTGVDIQQVFNKAQTQPQPSNVSKFAHFIGGVGSEIGHMVGGAATWLAKNGANMVTAPGRVGIGLGHAVLDNYDIDKLNAQTKQNSDMLNRLHSDFKAGRITAKGYQIGLKELAKEDSVLTKQHVALNNRISADQKSTYKATIDTASTLVTILTAGFGRAASVAITSDGLTPVAEKTAANYLASSNANALLSNVEQGLNKIATDPAVFAKLSPAAQKAVQTATAEVVAGNAGTMTGGQIARASAVNLMLKYPIYYNMLSEQGTQVYEKLDNKQYGDAVRQLAFNALLLFSGGPVGHALKYGGKALGGIGARTFGRTAFIDELSKGIGDGSPEGLYRAIQNIANPEDRAFAIKALSSVEATNMEAVIGKDATAAAWRVLNGMSSYEGLSMSQFTHDEALTNMVNFSKAQEMADTAAKSVGIRGVTVGRIDAKAKNWLSAQLSPLISSDKEVALNAWDALKAENPNVAWAHNDNFERQIKALINKHGDAGSFDAAMRSIKAAGNVKGFPDAVNRQLAKMGYVAIKPSGLEAPFTEGSGQLATKFADKGDDFFIKAVQPVPILGHIGDLLSHAGLSPTSSTSRVYQMFNDSLAENISGLNVINTTIEKGATKADTADNIIKTLSNYAHNPTRGIKVNGKPLNPISDLRQMTTKDVMEALSISKSEAREVKGAIMDSMLQVPLQVRGLGDKIADIAYKIPGQGRYLRIQQAARFAWNPFFQAKLAYKTELLAQAESHGKFPTLGGTNTILKMIFPDRYEKIDGIRGTLRKAGIFDEKATLGETLSGEAVQDAGVASANLTHRLIPSQERSIASMISVQADRLGLSVDDFVTQFPNEARDTVQMIAQYDRNSEFLNSAMARTLNLAFFPFRFEYKVASIMARSLARSTPMTQLAVINGLYRAHDWLNSTEGQVWYSRNSEVIGMIKYFTPIQTLGEVSSLLGGHTDSIGSYGELGGLPFGWIPQLLDAEGLTNFGGVYVDPKSGQAVPDYIPETDKAKLASALQDFIGSLFSYPGATLGLPSKTKLVQGLAIKMTGVNKSTEYSKVNPAIPEDQQGFSDTIQGLASQTLTSHLGYTPGQNTQTLPGSPNLQPGMKVPAGSSPLTTPVNKPSKSGSGSGHKKKGEFTPALLPGQSSLGQL